MEHGSQEAFWNLGLAVREAVISDEWRVARKGVVAWWATQAAFWNLSLAVRKAVISDEW